MKIQRTFLPGSEWLYYQIGCGESYSNIFLVETIVPLVNKLVASDIISQWFFVRLFENNPTLNIRLKIDNKKSAEVINLFHKKLQLIENQYLISDVKIRTYNRELERYGKERIAFCEYLFYLESKFITKHIIPLGQENDQIIKALETVKLYLSVFEKDINLKREFISISYEAFKEEFKIEKKEILKLNTKFKTLLPQIESNKNSSTYEESKDLKSIAEQLEKIKNIKSEKHYFILLGSLIHMLINRWFRTNQRELELVIYHHLKQLYKMNR